MAHVVCSPGGCGLVIYRLRVFAEGGAAGLASLVAGLKRFVCPPLPNTGESPYFVDLFAAASRDLATSFNALFRCEAPNRLGQSW